MSSHVGATQTWVHEYQARFGAAPGSKEDKTELERCVQICDELIAEHERGRARLAQLEAELSQYRKAVSALMTKEYRGMVLDKDTVFAEVVQEPSLTELIAELKREEA